MNQSAGNAPPCRGCRNSVYVNDEEMQKQIDLVLKSGVPVAEETLYKKRLQLCKNCEQLLYQSTCMSCGCLVQVRALNALRICPHPAGSKW